MMTYRWSKPATLLGRWSVGLNLFFLMVILIAIILVKVLGILSFDDPWWDITALVFIAPIVALVLGILALRKRTDHSAFVLLSIVISIGVVLFILLHSLFIAD